MGGTLSVRSLVREVERRPTDEWPPAFHVERRALASHVEAVRARGPVRFARSPCHLHLARSTLECPGRGSAGGVSHPERTGRQIEGVEVRARRLAPDPSSEAVHAPSRRPQGVGAPCGPDVVTLPPVEPDSRVRSIGSDVGGGGRNDARSNQRGGPITMPSRATGVLRWGRSTRPTVAREPGRRRTGANVLGMTGARELRCTLACCSTWNTARAPAGRRQARPSARARRGCDSRTRASPVSFGREARNRQKARSCTLAADRGIGANSEVQRAERGREATPRRCHAASHAGQRASRRMRRRRGGAARPSQVHPACSTWNNARRVEHRISARHRHGAMLKCRCRRLASNRLRLR